MKANFVIILLVNVLLFLNSCAKDPSVTKSNLNIDYSKFVTIKHGLWGSCTYLTGDCMPMIGGNSSCKSEPVKRTIYVYAPTVDSQAVQIGGPNSSFYSQINTQLIAQTQSEDNGFYQISLQPGRYTILILEQGKYYCMDWGGQHQLAPVTVDSITATRRDLVIDMAVH
ncbi:MAG TPA: hypothetical protein VKG26_16675 [Bacteroidia bacterium]|nr:hypothetical protein [Bacteroidia bacterium]